MEKIPFDLEAFKNGDIALMSDGTERLYSFTDDLNRVWLLDAQGKPTHSVITDSSFFSMKPKEDGDEELCPKIGACNYCDTSINIECEVPGYTNVCKACSENYDLILGPPCNHPDNWNVCEIVEETEITEPLLTKQLSKGNAHESIANYLYAFKYSDHEFKSNDIVHDIQLRWE